MKRVDPFQSTAFLTAAVLLVALPIAALDIQFTETGATATGSTPRGAVHWLGAGALLHEEIVYQFFDTQTLIDQDGDGTVFWEHGYPEATHSAWIAVDVASGEFALASPADLDSYRREFPALRLGSDLDQLDIPGHDLQILLIRPGHGAWTRRIFDGRNHDSDLLADGRLTLDLRDLQPIAESTEVVATLQPGDRLIAFDPERFTVAVTDLMRQDLDNAGAGGQGGK